MEKTRFRKGGNEQPCVEAQSRRFIITVLLSLPKHHLNFSFSSSPACGDLHPARWFFMFHIIVPSRLWLYFFQKAAIKSKSIFSEAGNRPSLPYSITHKLSGFSPPCPSGEFPTSRRAAQQLTVKDIEFDLTESISVFLSKCDLIGKTLISCFLGSHTRGKKK